MSFEIDNQSPPGSWVREWDARSHTSAEYRQEIRELRDRIKYYMARIEALETELMEERGRNSGWVREP